MAVETELDRARDREVGLQLRISREVVISARQLSARCGNRRPAGVRGAMRFRCVRRNPARGEHRQPQCRADDKCRSDKEQDHSASDKISYHTLLLIAEASLLLKSMPAIRVTPPHDVRDRRGPIPKPCALRRADAQTVRLIVPHFQFIIKFHIFQGGRQILSGEIYNADAKF